jgi:uncharacterized membrane protein
MGGNIMKGLMRLLLAVLVTAQAGLIARQVVTCEKLIGGHPLEISADGSIIVLGFEDKVYRWEDGSMELIPAMTIVDGISDDGMTITGGYNNSETNLQYWRVWENGQTRQIGYQPIHGTEISGDGKVMVATPDASTPSSSHLENALFRFANGSLTEVDSPYDGIVIPRGLSFNGDVVVGNMNYFEGFSLNNGTWTLLDPLPEENYCMANDVSKDGSLVIGTTSAFMDSIPCYWENGNVYSLESISTIPGVSVPHYVSGDGNVILGAVMEYLYIHEPAIWRREGGWTQQSVRDLIASSGIDSDVSQWDFNWSILSRDGSTIATDVYTENGVMETFRIQFSNMFGQYPIDQDIAETGNWMGTLHVSLDPWIWCDKVTCWFLIPEPTANAAQGWLYPPNEDSLQIWEVPGTDWGYSPTLEKWLYLTEYGWAYMM